MDISTVLQFEASVFIYGLAVILAWKITTARINMHGLLLDKSRPSQVSPERVQLLISTLVLAIEYVRKAGMSEGPTFPELEPGWLYLFGGSSLVYSVRKAVERFRGTQRPR